MLVRGYFGRPVYSYTLKQGIEDGFLAPYKVVKVHIDRDIEGYRPEPGKLDRDGNEIEDRIYNQKDFDRTFVIDERTKVVAKKITDFLKQSEDRFQKTIVFCVDTEHASRMRQALVNENKDIVAQYPRYITRITGNDPEGLAQLDPFIDPESRLPVIVTTSRLLSTGVDAQTCRVIAIDREIGSMTEFKQIVGRGTRIHEDTKKFYFTLIDFRKATNHFAGPDFDGEPVQIYQPGPDGPIAPPDDPTGGAEPAPEDDEVIVDPGLPPWDPGAPPDAPKKVYVSGVDGLMSLADRLEAAQAERETRRAVDLLRGLPHHHDSLITAPKSPSDGSYEVPSLPANWSWSRVAGLAAAEDNAITDGPFGAHLKTEHYVSSPGFRVIRLQNVGRRRFRDEHRSYISGEHFARLTRHHVQPGDLVVAGLVDPLIRCCRVPDAIGPALVKADCYRFAVHSSLRADFVAYYLNSAIAQRFPPLTTTA